MRHGRKGFTLVELLVTVVILIVLAAVTLGVAGRMKEAGHEARCVGNLRQWGAGLLQYIGDSGGKLPRRGQGIQPLAQIEENDWWFNCLPPYFGMPPYKEQYAAGIQPKPGDNSVFNCPSAKRDKDDKSRHFMSYAMNMYLSPTIRPEAHRLSDLDRVSQLVFMADAPGPYSSTVPSRNAYGVSARHSGKANVAFVDGHVQTFRGEYLGCGSGEKTCPDIRWQTFSEGVNQNPVP